MRIERALVCGWIVLGCAAAMAGAEEPEAVFHKAYYLETEQKNLPEAIRLYEQVAKSPAAPAEIVKRAEKRLAALKERLRASDLTWLVPPDILAYVEVRSPSGHLGRLLEMAGFLGGKAPAGAEPSGQNRPPVLVSPRLIETLAEIDGAALAITDFDPRSPPRGVFILHSGRSDLVQGLIETALSGAALSAELRPTEPVGGHPAYESPLGIVVTTEELVIAANPRDLAVDVIRRLHEDAVPSLGTQPAFGEMKARRADSLVFAFVNGPRAVELGRQSASRDGRLPKEYLLLQAVADVESLEWASLAIGTREDGLAAHLSLRLREGNHSFAYHFLRTPPAGREALGAVPAGAAAALALGLGEPGEGELPARGEPRLSPAVTGLDLGREIFANVNAVLAYALPPAGGAEPKAAPIPDAGLIFLVKDPSRSEALWKELLRIPATIFKAEPQPVRREEIEGQEVQVYAFPEQFHVYFVTLPSRVILATSRLSAAAAIKTAKGEASILEDQSLAGSSRAARRSGLQAHRRPRGARPDGYAAASRDAPRGGGPPRAALRARDAFPQHPREPDEPRHQRRGERAGARPRHPKAHLGRREIEPPREEPGTSPESEEVGAAARAGCGRVTKEETEKQPRMAFRGGGGSRCRPRSRDPGTDAGRLPYSHISGRFAGSSGASHAQS